MPNAKAVDPSHWRRLTEAAEQMATARSLERVVEIIRSAAREIVGCDGVTVVLREQDLCFYVAEDAIGPLWAGRRFPASTCVSGWAMSHHATVAIPDIGLDPRVPQAAYAATFVRSMVMVPVGRPEAVAAIGAYWAATRLHDPAEIERLEALARIATIAIERARAESMAAESADSLRALAAVLERRVEERGRELASAQEALLHAQKLEAIGQLTGGVAHDFNNLLAPIIAGLDALKDLAPVGARESRLLDAAVQSAERARGLVRRLLAFARRQTLRAGPVDVAELAIGARDVMAAALGPRIELAIEVEGSLPPALADRGQLEMVLLNLAVNARDAMPDGGRLTIRASLETDAAAMRGAALNPGPYLRLSVRDSGLGMDAATRRRAVEPFFTTKEIGHGTGLGLSMAHGLAQQLGGGLSITSAPGAGTTVDLWLPVCEERPIELPARPAESAPSPQPSGVALLVDDEALVRLSAADMLTEIGFQVIEATSAAEALQILDAGARCDLLVTDHLMPGMTGFELAEAARAARPELPILLMSGYSDEVGVISGASRLAKPFRQIELADSIQRLLA